MLIFYPDILSKGFFSKFSWRHWLLGYFNIVKWANRVNPEKHNLKFYC